MATTKTAALALVIALTQPVLAQETDGASAEGTITEEGLAMGVPAEGEGIGKPYIAAKFEAWEQRCLRVELDADPCELYYLLKDESGGAAAEFSMYGLPPSTESPAVAGATFVAPLETLLTSGVTMQIDDQEAKSYPFATCSKSGCIARLGFTAEEVEAMKQGGEVTMVLVPFFAPDTEVKLKMSLKGFTAGLDAVNAANAAADAAAAEAAAAAGLTEGTEATTAP